MTEAEFASRDGYSGENSSNSRRLLLWECFDDEAAFKAHFEYAHTKVYFALGLTEVLQNFKTTTVE